MDLLKFILSRGVGKHRIEDIKRFYSCFLGIEKSSEEIKREISSFEHPYIRVTLSGEEIYVEVDMIRYVESLLEEFSGKPLRVLIDEAKKRGIDSNRLEMILRNLNVLVYCDRIIRLERIKGLEDCYILYERYPPGVSLSQRRGGVRYRFFYRVRPL